jgi:hypothetical protein
MRIATYRHQNRRALGRLPPDGRALELHALGAEEERRGALALVERLAARITPPPVSPAMIPLAALREAA